MAVHIAFLVLVPLLLLEACKRSRALGAVGPTVLSYAAGILWGNLGFGVTPISMTAAEVTVPLAIPLLLFATDFMRWLRLARTTVLAFCLQIVAVLVAATLGGYLFAQRLPEGWKLAGMFVGVYTGGTVNLTAIGVALGAQQELFVLANAADMVVSSVYLLFLMSFAQPLLLRFLPPFRSALGHRADQVAAARTDPELTGSSRPRWDPVKALGLSVIIVAVSAGLALLLTGRLAETLVILSITTLGIAASFVRRVRSLSGAYGVGQYLLLVFCTAIGSTANFSNLVTSPLILYFCAFVIVVAVVLHVALAALFRIDADTVIITSTAGIFSPPFVGPVAAALKNPEIVVSGLTTGVIGYAIGNYLGIALAYLFKP